MSFGRLGTFGNGFGRLGHAPRTPWWLPGSTLDLDFVKNRARLLGRFYAPASLLTTTRASDAYADNNAGVWSLFSSNVPRITDLGLLVGESRTNLILRSDNFATGWTIGSSSVTVTTGVAESPISGVLADRLVKDATSSAYPITQTIDISGGAASKTFTVSVFLKSNTGASQTLRLMNSQGGVADQYTTITVTTSWQRFTLTRTNTASAGNGKQGIGIAGSDVTATYDVLATAAQLELGSFVTSPIRTTSAAATRAADSVTSSLIAPGSVGTLFAEWMSPTQPTVGQNFTIFEADDGGNDAADRIELGINTGAATTFMLVRSGGVTTVNTTPSGSFTYGTSTKIAMAYATNDVAGVLNGGTVGTDATATIPATTQFRLGSRDGANTFLNGYLRRIAYFPTRLSDAQLQALTA